MSLATLSGLCHIVLSAALTTVITVPCVFGHPGPIVSTETSLDSKGLSNMIVCFCINLGVDCSLIFANYWQ
jgi:hypothetical protein